MSITPIVKGAPLTAAAINAPLMQLSEQIDRTTEIVDASFISQSWYARDVPLQPGVVVGNPVYWNADNSRYELAIAGAEINSFGALALTDASDCVGIVTSVSAGDVGDVLIDGIADIDLSAAVDGDVVPGRYYLSSDDAGMLVAEKPPVAVFICRVLGKLTACNSVAQVLVRPQVRDVLLDHIHYRVPLACFPAGLTTPPTFGHKHTITSPNSTEQGWLPANNAIFEGNAPTNAVFGYNLSQEPDLADSWPPVPLSAVAVLLDRGIGQGATELPLGSHGLVICDEHGIWWMSDCYGDAPWPVHLNNTVIPASSYPHATSPDECPRIDHMRIEVCYSRLVYANDAFVVTSLSTPEGSSLVLTGKDSINGKTGDVTIEFDPNAAVSTETAVGSLAIKDITSEFKLAKGPIVEGIITASDAVTLAGTITRYLTPSDSDTPIVHQGIVSINVDVDPANRELTPPLIRLEGTVERFYKDVPYIGFPANKLTSIRMSFNVPLAGIPNPAKFRLSLMLLARAAGTFTAMTASYRRVATLANGAVAAMPVSDTALTIDTTVDVTLDQVAGVISSPITVYPGDTLFVTLTRPSDVSFNGEIGLTRISGITSES